MTVMVRAVGRALGWVRHHAGLVALVVVIVLVPLGIALRGAELRDDRRKAAATKVEQNDARIQQLQSEARIAALVAYRVCQVQNRNANATNRLVDYFEGFSKASMPGPRTDAFWARVPRPVAQRCTPPTQPPRGPTGP